MLRLERPEYTEMHAYDLCAKSYAINTKRGIGNRLDAERSNVENRFQKFDKLAGEGGLHKFPAEDSIGLVDKSDFIHLYDYQFRSHAGRDVYADIRSQATSGRCPYCSARIATTLDHFLPKSIYPVLSVCVNNLVPSCSECNLAKKDRRPQISEDLLFHPYYDDVKDGWLGCVICQGNPLSIKYSAIHGEGVSEETFNRIAKQFKDLRLGTLYITKAHGELSDIGGYLAFLHESGGAVTLRSHLDELHKSFGAHGHNSWRKSLYGGVVLLLIKQPPLLLDEEVAA